MILKVSLLFATNQLFDEFKDHTETIRNYTTETKKS